MSGRPSPSFPRTNSIVRTLVWGAFLASSWTWCIGMFLPALLIRDYGLWSFALFATPNVIGAALFGVVLRRPATQGRFIARHRRACMAFSWATIAFHVFFLAWLARGVIPSAHLVVVVLIVAIVLLAPGRARSARAWIGTFAFVLSVGLLLALIQRLEPAPASLWATSGSQGIALALMSPLVIIGFALCPYLDLTFHLARSEATGAPGTRAFIIGFGVMFFAMIVGTAFYAPVIIGWLGGSQPTGSVAALLAIHIVVQAGVTLGLHGRALGEAGAWASPSARGTTVGVCVLTGLVAIIGSGAGSGLVENMTAPEVVYRLFIGFYGLIFPAYVLIVGTLPADGTWRERRIRVLIFAFCVGVGAPMAFMAFIMRMEAWSVLAALVLLAGFGASRIARRSLRPPAPESN